MTQSDLSSFVPTAGGARGRQTAPASDDSIAAFFDRLVAVSRDAMDAAGTTIEQDHLIAERRIRLRFAGEALLKPVGSAFRHLRVERQEPPDLTVEVWDSASTGVTLPRRPWPDEAQTTGGEIPLFIDDRFHTHFDAGVHQLSMVDFESRKAVLWLRDHKNIPYWEQSAPLKSIMHVWMHRHGFEWIHGGAVGLPSGGALLVGPSGAGKSSSALACLHSALSYAGDDHCLVGFAEQPMVYSLYNSAKTHRKDLASFPFLRPLVTNPDDGPDARMWGKALCFMNEGYADKMISGFPLKVLLLARVTGERDTRIVPASAGQALRVIAPEVMMKWPTRARASFANLTKLFRQVPCYSLEVGTDRAQIPQAILEILSRR